MHPDPRNRSGLAGMPADTSIRFSVLATVAEALCHSPERSSEDNVVQPFHQAHKRHGLPITGRLDRNVAIELQIMPHTRAV